MHHAPNPSGDAPQGVTEYALGSLAPGTRFVLYGTTRAQDVTGTLLRAHESACTVQLDRLSVASFTATDPETGEKEAVTVNRGPRRESWAYNTPVGLAEPLAGLVDCDGIQYGPCGPKQDLAGMFDKAEKIHANMGKVCPSDDPTQFDDYAPESAFVVADTEESEE